MRAGTAVHAVLEIERVHPVDADQQHPLNAFVVVAIARVAGGAGSAAREKIMMARWYFFSKVNPPRYQGLVRRHYSRMTR